MSKGWIAVDFDGTYCRYDRYEDLHFGAVIPTMVEKIKRWIKAGYEVRIFTARVSHTDEVLREKVRKAIEDHTEKHVGTRLAVTNQKDFNMIVLYDDKAHHIVKNTGMTEREYEAYRRGKRVVDRRAKRRVR